MEEKKIIICGPPNSGNRLLRAIIRRNGHNQVKVVHTPDLIVKASPAKAIIIVRSQPFWRERLLKAYEKPNGMQDKQKQFIFEALKILYPLRPLIITYEGLVAHTKAVAKAVFEYCEIDKEPEIIMEIYDKNAY